VGTLGRISNIQFFGGPHDKRTASMTYIPNLVLFHDGPKLMIQTYAKADELIYLYSTFSSLPFPRTTGGRASFLDASLEIPDYGLIWETKLLK